MSIFILRYLFAGFTLLTCSSLLPSYFQFAGSLVLDPVCLAVTILFNLQFATSYFQFAISSLTFGLGLRCQAAPALRSTCDARSRQSRPATRAGADRLRARCCCPDRCRTRRMPELSEKPTWRQRQARGSRWRLEPCREACWPGRPGPIADPPACPIAIQ